MCIRCFSFSSLALIAALFLVSDAEKAFALRPPLFSETGGHYQPHPIPSAPDAPTGSNYIATVAQPWYLRHWLEPFKTSGEAHAPWKDDALRLLQEETFGLAYGWRTAMNDIRCQTPPLIERGCMYPVIRWMYAMHLESQKKNGEALKVLDKLNQDMSAETNWPSPLRALAVYGVMQLSSNATTEANLVDALVTTLSDGSFKTNETRVVWEFLKRCDMDRNPKLLERLSAPTPPPVDHWFALMMRARQAFDRAWTARGGGYAYTVSDEGWDGYRKGIKEASELLTRAWMLHPENPDAAVLMIDCSRGVPDECRRWFDRAVAAQMDALDAYSSYRFTLRPRWGGSLPAMEAFAEECLNTKRFDTRVPLQYVVGLYNVADEMGEEWQAVFQKQGVYEQCQTILSNDLACTFGANWIGRRYDCTALAYTAYAAGDYDAAWKAHAGLRNPAGQYGFDKRIRPPSPFNHVAISLISAMNGPNKTAMRAADRLARTRPPDEALAAFRTLSDGNRLTEEERDGVCYWNVELGKRRACANGETFSLLQPPMTHFPGGPWISYYNSWQSSNLTLRTESKNGLMALAIVLPRNIRYELTFAPIRPNETAPCHFGFALDSKPDTTLEGPVLWLARGNGAWSAQWMRRFGPDARRSRPLSDVTRLNLEGVPEIRLVLTVKDNRVTALINGKTIAENLDLSGAFYDTLESGRLPYLFGSNVVLSDWRMTCEKDSSQVRFKSSE